jgi:aryl sulfotransferase
MSLIWLVSFPKSGNTWVRAFLSAYEKGEVDVNNLYGTPIASAREMLDKQLRTKTAELTDGATEALRPQAYVNLSAKYDQKGVPGIVKVHDRWKLTNAGRPLFPRVVTKATIYIVRDPLDVTVSLSHHLGISVQLAADWICNEQFQLLSEGEGKKSQVRQLIGSWKSHAASWIDRVPYKVHLVKYEDMHADPVKAFTGILAAIGFEIVPARVAEAVHACRFPALQAQELVKRFKEKSPKADKVFFRRGRVGDYASELPPALVDKVRNYNGEMMRRLGYK